MKRVLIALTFFAALVGIWQILYLAKVKSPVLLPSPGTVGQYLLEALQSGTIAESAWVTIKRLMTGYLAGCVIGLPLGLLTARSRLLNDTIGVLALGLQTLPSVCWVPMAILWFGMTETTMQFVVIMGTLWSVVIAVDNGVRNLPPLYVRAARTMGSRGMHTLVRVILPASLPYIVSGMKQGWAFAWRSLMAAEIFVPIATGEGLGLLMHMGRDFNRMDVVLGIMLVIIFIGLLADKILFSPWERFIHHRWGTAKA
jgi:NitT/TauT family transport system permease protein